MESTMMATTTTTTTTTTTSAPQHYHHLRSRSAMLASSTATAVHPDAVTISISSSGTSSSAESRRSSVVDTRAPLRDVSNNVRGGPSDPSSSKFGSHADDKSERTSQVATRSGLAYSSFLNNAGSGAALRNSTASAAAPSATLASSASSAYTSVISRFIPPSTAAAGAGASAGSAATAAAAPSVSAAVAAATGALTSRLARPSVNVSSSVSTRVQAPLTSQTVSNLLATNHTTSTSAASAAAAAASCVPSTASSSSTLLPTRRLVHPTVAQITSSSSAAAAPPSTATSSTSASAAASTSASSHATASVHASNANANSLMAIDSPLTLSLLDAPHVGNAQMCTGHIDQIMQYLKSIESRRLPHPNYMSLHREITPRMREILIDWLVDVHHRLALVPETLYLCCNLIDRYLERRAVSRSKLQLVGCAAMLLASKYEEVYAPLVKDFVIMADKTYPDTDIRAMESSILKCLEFNLTFVSSFRFLQRFLLAATPNAAPPNLYINDRMSAFAADANGHDGAAGSHAAGAGSRTTIDSAQRLHLQAMFLLELTLQDYHFLHYNPSVLAAGAVCLAVYSQGGRWTNLLLEHTGYPMQSLRACGEAIYNVAVGEGRYRAVKRKYCDRRYGEVSQLPLTNPWASSSSNAANTIVDIGAASPAARE